MGYIQGLDRGQVTLFPDTLDDYIKDDSCVRIIDEYVEQLDMIKLGFERAIPASLGRPPYNPRDLLKLYIYGYLNRTRSSRRLEHETHRNIEVIWLLRKLTPDHKTIADFRKDNKKALRKVYQDFTSLCKEWGLFGKELVAVDGAKFRASSSKKKSFSAKKIKRHQKYIDEKIDSYLKELEENDTSEETHRDPTAEEVKDKIKELRERRQKYEELEKELKESGQKEISLTDPDARTMNDKNSYHPSYNVQTTVDAKHKLIADFDVSQSPNDIGELANMALRAKELFDGQEFEVVADKGYYNAPDLKTCVENGITPYVARQSFSNGTGDKDFYPDKFQYNSEKDVYVCPVGKELNYYRIRRQAGEIIGYEYRNHTACKGCPVKEKCTKSKKGRSIFRHKDQDFLDTIDKGTEVNKEKYRLRQTIVEHPFGTVKRSWGAHYFLTRTRLSVTAEVSLTFLSYNLRRVINILGAAEIIKRLRERRNLVLA